MYCSKCGTPCPDDSIFCFNCGEKFLLDSTSEELQNTGNEEKNKINPDLVDESDEGRPEQSSVKRSFMSLKEFEIYGEVYNVTKVAESLFLGNKDEAVFQLELLTGLDSETCNGFIPEIQKLTSMLEKNYKAYPVNGSLYNIEKVLDLLDEGDALSAYESLKRMGIEEDVAKRTIISLRDELDSFRKQRKETRKETGAREEFRQKENNLFDKTKKIYCTTCGEAMNDNQAICLKCGVKKGVGNAYCYNCGKPLTPDSAVCLNCGVAVKKSKMQEGDYNGYSKIVIAVVCFFLGGLGIHNFMMGETKKGIVRIIATCIFGIGIIIALIDFVRILIDSYEINPDKFF